MDGASRAGTGPTDAMPTGPMVPTMDSPPALTAQPLETSRLDLEPLRVEHASELARVLDDPSLHRFTGGAPPTLEELRQRLERQTLGRSPDGRAAWLNWVVRERATARVVGTVQATVKGGPIPTAELAWVVGAQHQGNGFAREAAATMATWLGQQGVLRLRANIHPRHHASIAVAEAIGLEPSGTIVDGESRWESPPSA
jgi:RimJ/RimL family protein N-acetyltransferase